MSVIRVGFLLESARWTGGRNYIRNLLFALHCQSESKIQPVIFVGSKEDVSSFDGLAEIIRSTIFDRYSIAWWVRQIGIRICLKRDYVTYFLLKRHNVDVVSHFPLRWKGKSPLRTLAWIPDFQHIHLPYFFSDKEIAALNTDFMHRICDNNGVILSSYDALKDLKVFCPANKKPAHVLHFVSCHAFNQNDFPSCNELMKKYQIEYPWFHLPNQFWAHKNHKIVVEALDKLKTQGKNIRVIATGNTEDYRNPDYFTLLMQDVSRKGLEENFKVLGLVPYTDMLALMYYSIAVINPSLFEGWSSTVEEAKSMGKRLLLSDIAVHREQNPESGIFFDPNDADSLREALLVSKQEFNPDCLCRDNAKNELKHRINVFSREYENIIDSVIDGEENALP
jgi:glycosyltransferase involved in cell wall biosynthesis